MKNAGDPADGDEERAVTVQAQKGETEADTMARVMVEPYFRHGILAKAVGEKTIDRLPGNPHFDDYGRAMHAKARATGSGDLGLVSEMLTAQALSLDTIFTEMARRAAMNMGDYPQAAERYARLAFKAQSNCRTTLEALAKLHQPREQTVKHVHVNQGGQAVVADEFHNYTGGSRNGKSIKQSDATDAAGVRAALPCTDASGNGVPIPGGKGAAAMQNARRDESRSA